MFRDEFDPGGVVERVEKSGIRYTLPLFLVWTFSTFALWREGRKEKKRERKEKERGKETKEEKTTSYAYTLTFPRSLGTYLTLL